MFGGGGGLLWVGDGFELLMIRRRGAAGRDLQPADALFIAAAGESAAGVVLRPVVVGNSCVAVVGGRGIAWRVVTAMAAGLLEFLEAFRLLPAIFSMWLAGCFLVGSGAPLYEMMSICILFRVHTREVERLTFVCRVCC